MKVLIALDAMPQCSEIVRAAATRPWPAGTVFLLLHVLDPFPFAKMPLSLGRAKDETGVQLRKVGEQLQKVGWETETDVVLGRPRQAISQIAATRKADMVMVGSNEAGALTRLFLGSTAGSALRQVPCSVEVVRPLPRKASTSGLRILVATDGSDHSNMALRSVASRPWPEGSKVKVISIPEPFMALGEFPYFELKEIENLNTRAIKRAQRHAAAGAKLLSKAGLESAVETPLPRDSAAREILKEAERWKADLVVLGSHGRRGFERLTLGSVSEHVALHAPCSVEVIRAPLARSRETNQSSKKGAKR